jgi:hypothetical protein
MADIRLSRPPGSRTGLMMVGFAVVGLLFWASAYVVGDATEETRAVGAAAGFGSDRAPILAMESVPFGSLFPLQTRDLGRLVRVTGVAESAVRVNSVWVRTSDGFRILVRFQPAPDPERLRRIGPGTSVDFDGYLDNIALAEFNQIVDSLGVRIPRPPPGRKFGDLPDPGFARVDSLFIKNYYVSVRPEGIERERETPPAPRTTI